MARGGGRHIHTYSDDPRRAAVRLHSIPWLVGLTITAAYWFTSSTSFANPAVTLARGFTTTFAGIAINHVPAFVVATIGALIAAMLATVLFRSTEKIEIAARASAERSLAPGE